MHLELRKVVSMLTIVTFIALDFFANHLSQYVVMQTLFRRGLTSRVWIAHRRFAKL